MTGLCARLVLEAGAPGEMNIPPPWNPFGKVLARAAVAPLPSSLGGPLPLISGGVAQGCGRRSPEYGLELRGAAKGHAGFDHDARRAAMLMPPPPIPKGA